MSKRARGEGIEHRKQFNVPCSFDTFSVLAKLFTFTCISPPSVLHIGLSVDQVNWTLMHLNEKNGCPWSYRDSTTSDSCKIFGTICLTWFNGFSLFYSHDNCRRCAASEEELVTSGDTGGLDYCYATVHS